MKLQFDRPRTLPDTAHVAVLDPGAGVDFTSWVAAHVEAGGTEVRKLSSRVDVTSRGWPVELITYAVDGRLAILAVFSFIDLLAAVAIRGLDPAQLAHYEPDVMTALRAAEPDWATDEPRTISELWLAPSQP